MTITCSRVDLPTPARHLSEVNGHNEFEAIHLLAWAIQLQKYRGQETGFAWYDADSTRRGIWLPSSTPEQTVRSALDRAISVFHSGRSDETTPSPDDIDTAVRFLDDGPDGAVAPDEKLSIELHVSPSQFTLHSSALGQHELADHAHTLTTILQSLLDKRETGLLREVDFFSRRDRDLVHSWNEFQSPEADCCLHDILEQQARLTPRATAVQAAGGSISYEELDLRSTRLAAFLVSNTGVVVEQFVGFAFEKSLNAIVVLLALLKAGGVYVPLDHTHPPAKLQASIDDLNLTVVLCSTATEASLPPSSPHSRKVIIDSKLIEACARQTDILPPRVVAPQSLATLLHTSGTTGKPKAVAIEHNAFASCCKGIVGGLGIRSESRIFQFASFTYDLFVSDVFCAFTCGACLCVPSEFERLNDIAGAISSMRVNHATLTPAVAAQIDPDAVPTLQTLCLGGEPLPKALVRRWGHRVVLMNVYGITETCAWTTATDALNTADIEPSNIGRPMCGRIWLADLDDFRRLAPVGGIGEICIESPTLARHYHRNPIASEKAFAMIPHYLDPSSNVRIYRSGDIGRYTHDGQILCLGRRDAQVKISGQRVELSGVESRMKDFLPLNSEAAAVVIRPTDEDPVLIGFLALPASETRINLNVEQVKKELDRSLRDVLPKYMVPSLLFDIERFPVARTGKLDRAALARQATERVLQSEPLPQANVTASATLTATENTLRALWAEVLRIEPTLLGKNANLLHFGDSVSAMKLSALARRKGYSIDVADIMRRPVLAELAAFCDLKTLKPTNEDPDPESDIEFLPSLETLQLVAAACGLPVDQIEEVLPCTPLQEGLMALSIKEPGSYVTQEVRKLASSTDAARFMAAWSMVARLDAIMRTRIVELGGVLSQSVCFCPIAWDQASSLEEYTARSINVPMVLGSPLTRFALIEQNDDRWFVLTRHHATFDGYSQSLIDNHFERIYNGEQIPRPSKFSNFVRYLGSRDNQATESYWQAQLETAEATAFPPNLSARRGRRAEARFGADICFSKPQGPTPSILVRAAWALLVGKHCLSDDLIIGTTLSGRNVTVVGLEDVAGPTITTVPVRVRIRRSQTVRDFLFRMQEQSIEMIPHEHLGLARIRKLCEGADAACAFDNLLVVNPAEEEEEERRSLVYADDCRPDDWDGMSRTFAITLQVFLNSTGARVVVAYDGDFLSEWFVAALLAQLEHVLQQMCAAPDSRIDDLSFFSPADEEQLVRWSPQPVQHVDRCIHSIFAERVAEAPHSCAVLAFDGTMTYEELDKASDKLANHLSSKNVVPETIVSILYEKSLWAEVCLLAVIKSGGAFLLLDPDLPQARLQTLVYTPQHRIMLTSPKLAALAQSMFQEVCVVSKESVQELPDCASGPITTVQPHNTLYIMYTSGTTGTPKASVLDHQAYASSANAMRKSLRLGKSTRALHFASHSFDASVEQLLATVLYGGTICIPNDRERNGDLVAAINRMGVNFLRLTPSFARSLEPSEIPCVRSICLMGEPLTQYDLDKWKHIQLFEGWGPSECTNSSAIMDITGSNVTLWASRRCGLRATDSVKLYIVEPDNHHRRTPVGGIGEVLIDGPNVAQCYLNDPERTTQAFVDRPSWMLQPAVPAGRKAYKTGDLFRHGSDGSIIFVGRKDATQVKIRGQRLELGEVEHQVGKHLPSSTQVIVEAATASDGKEPMLVAFIHDGKTKRRQPIELGNTDEGPTPFDPVFAQTDQWKDCVATAESMLMSSVPAYFIPVFWIPLRYIPSSHSNKIDRRALRLLASGMNLSELRAFREVSAPSRTAAKSVPEQAMLKYWTKVLGLAPCQVSLEQSFLQMGGNSIDAMRVASMAGKEGLSLSVAQIFKNPKLEDMAAMCKSSSASDLQRDPQNAVQPFQLVENPQSLIDDIARICCIERDKIVDLYPCTSLQAGLMAISVKTPGREVARFSYALAPDTDLVRLERAWNATAAVAPILRTRIVTVSGHTLQVVVDEDLEWSEDGSLSSCLQHDPQNHMTLGTRLCHLGVFTDGDNGSKHLSVSIHHAIYDGWSLRAIGRAVNSAYTHGQITAPSTAFRDFIAHLQQQDLNSLEQSWAERLSGAQPGSFPRLLSAAYSPHSDNSLERRIHLGEEGSEVTLPTIFRAAWALVVAAHTSNDDVVFGATVHGRNVALAGAEEILGPTFTTVPVRIRVDRNLSVGDYLHAVQQDGAEVGDIEHLGLQQIRDIDESTRRACSFQNVLVVQPGDSAIDPHGVLGARKDLDDPSDLNSYGIMLDVKTDATTVTIQASFDSSLIDVEQMRRVVDQFAHVVCQLRSRTQTHLSDIEIISPEDIRDIRRWNREPPVTLYRCIHDIIADQTQMRMDKEAVCAWDGSLRYRDLDLMSSRLAAHLKTLGAGKNSIIPLCFDKSMWAVVAVVAVMKSGAAFVLLDPAHQPIHRMKLAVQAVNGSILVCAPKYTEMFPDLRHIVPLSEATMHSFGSHSLARDESSSPDDLLCVLFTSGSTGTPKGILHSHEGFASSFDAFGPCLGIDANTRLLQFSAYAFDACVGDILAPLMHGGTVCIPSEDQRMNDISGAINQFGANWALLTPSFARSLDPSQIPCLTTVLLGGESILPSDEMHWADRTLLTGYGPAESSLCMAGTLGTDRHAPNLGWPVGCRTWVTDVADQTKLVPIGVGGHLVVEGPVIAAGGYLNDPKRTAASFISEQGWLGESKSSLPQRFFKTGDLVRYASDGSLIFMGRLDTQIKLRGQRIEIDELEFHLESALAARYVNSVKLDSAAGMTAPPGSLNPNALAVFVANEDWCEWNTEVGRILSEHLTYLQRYLAELLPSYMIPSLIIPISRMPYTISGKLDRKELSRIVSGMSEETLARLTRTSLLRAAPVGDAETRLCQLFAEALRCDESQVYADDSLIRLGGDSISAMKLAALARAEGMDFSVADIFNLGTPQKLAQLTSTKASTMDEDPLPFSQLPTTLNDAVRLAAEKHHKIASHTVQDIYPCTPLQAGLFSMSLVREGAYAAVHAFEIPETVDIKRLTQSWELLVKLHSVLRTTIVAFGEALYQVVIDGTPSIPVLHATPNLTTPVDMGLGRQLNQFAIYIDEQAGKSFFLWYSHHSAYDGWSMRLLLNKLEDIYKGVNTQALPAFSRFVKHATSNDDSSVSFWKDQVRAAGEIVLFPRLPNQSVKPSGMSILQREIEITRQNASSVTTSTIIKAALALVLQQRAPDPNSNTVPFGIVQTGRTGAMPGIEAVAGPTLATVPLLISAHPSESLTDFLIRVQQQGVDMLPHEQFGLQNIARLSEACKEATAFQTLLAIQPLETYDVSPDEVLKLLPGGERASAFYTHGLTLQCFLHDSGFRLKVNYDNALLAAQDVEDLVEHFDCVVRELVSPSRAMCMRDLPTVSPTQMARLLDWNSIELYEEKQASTIPERILQRARSHPLSPAVCAWDFKLTYGSLVSLATKLAMQLQTLGVGPNVVVPLCFEKSAWAVVSQMAVLLAGGAFVSLDPSYPVSRVRKILESVGATAPLLHSTSTRELVRAFERPRLEVSAEIVGRSDSPMSCDLAPAAPGDLMYVIYTSGTTSEPKGVMIEHGAFDASSRLYGKSLQMNEEIRVLQFASYVFDASVLETFSTLSFGGCVCVPRESDRLERLARTVTEYSVNWALLTASVLRLIEPSMVPCLKTLVVGAEAVEQDTVRTWASHVDLFQAYGPAEASIICTTSRIQSENDDSRLIGKPVNCHAWVVQPDDYNRLAGLGCVGELVVSGPTLARGYLGNRQKTESVFVTDPAWATALLDQGKPAARFYKTGDLVKYADCGSLVFIGRKDNQIKINGQRVEIAEIENQIRRQLSGGPLVAVELIKGGTEGLAHCLVAVISFASSISNVSATTELRDLQAALRDVLPSHMVPNRVMHFDHIPLNYSGKTDRQQLRKMICERLQLETASRSFDARRTTPFTPWQKRLQPLWEDTLGVQVGSAAVEDDFFDAGDSISAIRLVSSVANAGLELHAGDIFRLRKFGAIAQAIVPSTQAALARQEDDDPASGMLEPTDLSILAKYAIDQKNVEAIQPALGTQQHLMRESLSNPGANMMQSIYELDSTCDVDLFQKSWQLVADSTEALRTRLVTSPDEDKMFQVLLRSEFAWQETDSFHSYAEQDRSNLFRLGEPLVRYAVARENESTYFIFTIHHSLYDGWSIGLLLAHVQTTYEALLEDHRPDLMETSLRPLLKHREQQGVEQEKVRFAEEFAGLMKPTQSLLGSPGRLDLPQATETLRKNMTIPSCQQKGPCYTPANLLRAAWALILANAAAMDVTYGTFLANRNAPVAHIENAIGPILAKIPVRVRFEKTDMTVVEYLQATREQAMALARAEYNLGMHQIAEISDSCARACEFQSMFVIHPPETNGTVADRIGMRKVYVHGFHPHELVVEVLLASDSDSCCTLQASWDRRALSMSQAESLLDVIGRVARQLAEEERADVCVGKLDASWRNQTSTSGHDSRAPALPMS